MKRTGWIGLLVVGMAAAFAVGLVTGKGRKPEEAAPRELVKVERENPRAPDYRALRASLERFRVALAEKEEEVERLRSELEEVRAKLPAPLPPEEERREKEQEETRKRDERRSGLYEKSKLLRAKILQRRDKALREEGLTEVATLIQSGQAEEMVLGLMTLFNLWGFNLDKERFLPDVLEALKHEDAEVRLGALSCVRTLCSPQELLGIALSMKGDPSPEVRTLAAHWLPSLAGPEWNEEVASALKALLRDEDRSVRNGLAEELSRGHSSPHVSGAELEDIMIKLSKDKETAYAAREWMLRTGPVSARIAQRIIEMHGEDGWPFFNWGMDRDRILDEAKPVIRDFSLRVVRDSLDQWERRGALDRLRDMGDPSVIPQLEEIARSPDAEGIEEHLAKTIEELRQRANQPR